MRAALLAITVAALLVVGAAPAISAAQDDGNATNSTGPTIGEDWQQVDSALYVTDWRYDDDRGEFEIEFHAQRPRTVTVVESIKVDEETAGTFSVVQQRIVGNQTVAVPAGQGPNGEASVSITTQQSLNREQGVFLSTGHTTSDPLSTFGGRQGLFVGMGLAVLFALLAAWALLRGEKSGVEVAA